MGRELKRVALDFQWPLNKTWEGYINPFWKESCKCKDCNERGLNLETRILNSLWYRHLRNEAIQLLNQTNNETLKEFVFSIYRKRALGTMFFNWAKGNVKESILSKLLPLKYVIFSSEEEMVLEMLKLINNNELYQLQNYINECSTIGWADDLENEEIEALVAGGRIGEIFEKNSSKISYLYNEEEKSWQVINRSSNDHNDWKWTNCEKPTIPPAIEVNKFISSKMPFGHDGINHWICVKNKATRMGFYSLCEKCNGEGYTWPSKEIQESYEKWESYGPPKGDGYQLWETTSEGSPTSPVFKTLDELCEYAEENCTTFGSSTVSKERWKEMLDENFVRDEVVFEDKDGNQKGAIFI